MRVCSQREDRGHILGHTKLYMLRVGDWRIVFSYPDREINHSATAFRAKWRKDAAPHLEIVPGQLAALVIKTSATHGLRGNIYYACSPNRSSPS